MKFTRMKNEPNMGKVWNDDKTVFYGIYGQVGTLLDKRVLYHIDASRDMWIFIPKGIENGTGTPYASKEELKRALTEKFSKGESL